MDPLVQSLVNYMIDNPKFGIDFAISFVKAVETGIDLFGEYNISNLTQYIDWYNSLLTWLPSENIDGTKILEILCLVSTLSVDDG